MINFCGLVTWSKVCKFRRNNGLWIKFDTDMNRVSMIRLGWDKIVDDSVWAILNLGVGILGFGNIRDMLYKGACENSYICRNI